MSISEIVMHPGVNLLEYEVHFIVFLLSVVFLFQWQCFFPEIVNEMNFGRISDL